MIRRHIVAGKRKFVSSCSAFVERFFSVALDHEQRRPPNVDLGYQGSRPMNWDLQFAKRLKKAILPVGQMSIQARIIMKRAVALVGTVMVAAVFTAAQGSISAPEATSSETSRRPPSKRPGELGSWTGSPEKVKTTYYSSM
jgi:hypothetical protein